ncbi:hypothetical protein [Nonomuraea typhae]|uniref:DUF4352 domain-containing protein n=1 Tax=Nonomuraea typhae TaxID=2603600 RepID=A0ABW7Z0G6_9ACTN
MTMRNKLALLLAIPVLAGCGMLPGQVGAGGEEKQASSPATAPDTTQETTQEKTPPTEQPAEADALPAVVTRKVKHDDSTLRIDITQLKRTGKTVTLTWTVTNTSADGSWYVGSNLGTDSLDTTTAAVALIDSVNGKRYRVARNGAGEKATCVCSRVNQHLKAGGGAMEMYAVYGAPPADVTKVNVEMGDLGVFNDVPLS